MSLAPVPDADSHINWRSRQIASVMNGARGLLAEATGPPPVGEVERDLLDAPRVRRRVERELPKRPPVQAPTQAPSAGAVARSADRFQALWSYYGMEEELYPEHGQRERRRGSRRGPMPVSVAPHGERRRGERRQGSDDQMAVEPELGSAEELLPGEAPRPQAMPTLYRGEVHLNKKMNVLMEELIGL